MILPPDVRTLRDRLQARGTDDEATIARRMQLAADQLRAAPTYDYVVVNDDLAAGQAALEGILLAEMSRTSRRRATIERIVAGLDPVASPERGPNSTDP